MNIIENVFEWMLAATLRASVLAVVILGIQFMLRRWLPAGWRHALWLPMVAVLVLPVLPEASFGLFPLKREAAVVLPEIEVVTGIGQGEEAVAAAAPVVEKVEVNYLAVAWFAGACGVLGAGLLGYRRNMVRVKAAASGPDAELAASIEAAAREAGLGKAPQVMVSPAVNSPAVTGFLRPVLLLPAGFPAGFSGTEARLILLHEFSHLKRLDLPLNWLACGLQAMHWFNPLLWFAFARMRADREAACDARVLSLDATDCRSQYGGALLKLQCVTPTRVMSLGFVGIFERGSEMKARIRGISTHRPGHFAWQAAGGTILAALTVFGVTRAQDEELPTHEAEAGAVIGQAAESSEETGGAAYILNKLRNVVVPGVDFRDTTLEEAADFLALRARELDVAELDPAKKGVNFVIRKPRPGGEPYRKITLKLRDVPLAKLAGEMARQSGARYKIDDFAVTFVPEGEVEADFVRMPEGADPFKGQTGKVTTQGDGQAGGEKSEVILPRVEFTEVTLIDAVTQLNASAEEAAKGQPVPKVVLDGSGDPGAKVRELMIRNVPLSVAVRYCAEQTKHKVVAKEGELRITKDAAPPAGAPVVVEEAADKAKPAGKALEAAHKIIIPRIDFLSVTLQEAVDFLNLRAKELSKDEPFFPVVIDPAVDATKVINSELRLRNVPLSVALKYCVDAAGLRLTGDDKEIRISKRP